MRNYRLYVKVVIMAVCLLLIVPMFGIAEESIADEKAIISQLQTLPDFKFQIHEEGIGTGTVPVYTAPSLDAYRCGDGKARYNISNSVSESNYVDGWLLVRYRTVSNVVRVGYTPPKYVNGFVSRMPKLEFVKIPVTAAVDIPVTDDPVEAYTPFGTIHKGENFYILRKYTYTGNWWYVECTVEGKIARGFVDRNTAAFYLGRNVDVNSNAKVYNLKELGYPETAPNGSKRIGHVQVNSGKRKIVRKEPSVNATQITVAYADRFYPCYDVKTTRSLEWFYIWIEEDSKWGWISSANGILVKE